MVYYNARTLFAGIIILIIMGSVSVYAESPKSDEGATIASGSRVSIEYTLKLGDGTVVDSNKGAAPFTFIQGARQIIPGLEKALDGMRAGGTKEVKVKPEDGYGMVKKDLLQEVKKDLVPKDAWKVDSVVQGQDSRGQIVQARVVEVKDNTVLLDFNHPLAGKTLYFDVKVLDVKDIPFQ